VAQEILEAACHHEINPPQTINNLKERINADTNYSRM
jgi:hypothetical protein